MARPGRFLLPDSVRSTLIGRLALIRQLDFLGLAVLESFASNENARLAHSDWLVWVVPLVLVEANYGRKWNRLLREQAKGMP